MAVRPTWKGYLKVSLVSIPINVFPATESSGTISFNQLHGECRTRIQQERWCPSCEREVASSELVKGYEFEKGQYVVLTEEDLDNVRPASTRVIEASFDKTFDMATYQDEYTEDLRKVIDAKIAGREVAPPQVDTPPKVVNLLEALRKSLDSVSAERKKPARVAAVKRASLRVEGKRRAAAK